MWIRFTANHVAREGTDAYPMAVRIAAGKVNAVSGKEWKKKLKVDDYVVVPPQPWLDGFCVEPGKIRQFVAMPLGWGMSVEQQVTGKEEHGGLQIEVYPMRGDEFEKRFPKPEPRLDMWSGRPGGARGVLRSHGETKTAGGLMDSMDYERGDVAVASVSADMGLGAGGMMTQRIYDDPYGKDVWVKRTQASRTFVHLANSFAWEAITGYSPPATPCTAEAYAARGLPWYNHYLDGMPIKEGGKNLKSIKSVLALGFQKGLGVFPNNDSVKVKQKQVVQTARPKDGVRNGAW